MNLRPGVSLPHGRHLEDGLRSQRTVVTGGEGPLYPWAPRRLPLHRRMGRGLHSGETAPRPCHPVPGAGLHTSLRPSSPRRAFCAPCISAPLWVQIPGCRPPLGGTLTLQGVGPAGSGPWAELRLPIASQPWGLAGWAGHGRCT